MLCSPSQQGLRRWRWSIQSVHPQAGDAAGPQAGRQSPLTVAQRQALRPGAVEWGRVGVPGEGLGKERGIVSNLRDTEALVRRDRRSAYEGTPTRPINPHAQPPFCCYSITLGYAEADGNIRNQSDAPNTLACFKE